MALNWLATEAGRKFTRTAVGLLGGVGFGVYLLPHTYFLDKTKEIVQMYKLGSPVSLDGKIKARATEVLQDLTYLLEREKSSLTFFTVYGPDVFHKGSTQLRSGAIIGLPVNYSYESPHQVEKNQLQLGRHPNFNWQSDVGNKLIESLILQPHAQKFAIAREIVYCNTNYVYTNAVVAVSSFLAAYMAGNFINRSLHMYERARKQRLIMYGILGALGGVLYLILTDALSLHYDRYVDKKVANLGKEYVMGGVEYYQKVLDRNKAIRRALGATGESWYTSQGNENEWIRVRHMPLTARLDYMKNRQKEYERKKADSSRRDEPPTPPKQSKLDFMSKGVTPAAPVQSARPESKIASIPPMHNVTAHSTVPKPTSPSASSLPMHSLSNKDNTIAVPKINQKQPQNSNVDRPATLSPPLTPSSSAPHSQLSTPAYDSHVCKMHQKHSMDIPPSFLPQATNTQSSNNRPLHGPTQSMQHFNKQSSIQSPSGNQPSRSYSPHVPPPSVPTSHNPLPAHQPPAPINQSTISPSGMQVPNPVHQSNAMQQPQVKLTGGHVYPRNTPVAVDGIISYNIVVPQETHEKVQLEASTPSIIPELFRATFNNLWQIIANF